MAFVVLESVNFPAGAVTEAAGEPKPSWKLESGPSPRKLRPSHEGHVPHSRWGDSFGRRRYYLRATPSSFAHPRNVNVVPTTTSGNQLAKVNIAI